jgi:hypothetical protein
MISPRAEKIALIPTFDEKKPLKQIVAPAEETHGF